MKEHWVSELKLKAYCINVCRVRYYERELDWASVITIPASLYMLVFLLIVDRLFSRSKEVIARFMLTSFVTDKLNVIWYTNMCEQPKYLFIYIFFFGIWSTITNPIQRLHYKCVWEFVNACNSYCYIYI